MLVSSLMKNCCNDGVSTIHSDNCKREIISFANKVETEVMIKLRSAYNLNASSLCRVSKRRKKNPVVDRNDFNSHSARKRRRFVDRCEEMDRASPGSSLDILSFPSTLT